MRIRTKKSSENSLVTKTHLQSLVRTAKYDVEMLVCMQIFLSVFWNPEVLKNGGFRKHISVDRAYNSCYKRSTIIFPK